MTKIDADVLAQPGSLLLDTARPDEENDHSLLFAEPRRILRAERPGDMPRLLRAVDEAVAEGQHLAGYLSYEAGYPFVELTPPETSRPLAWLGVYDEPQRLRSTAVKEVFRNYEETPAHPQGARLAIERATYLDRLHSIKRYIRAGDVYQVNFTDRVEFDVEGDPLAFYAHLRQRQRVSYGAFLNTGARRILSLSPELFFRREGERVITRPMKGTIRRGCTNAEDEVLQETLSTDEKSRAENLMIVDLLRNDLARCCRPGSVRVPALFETERYESVIQMTSTVEGRLKEGVGYVNLFRALFPCGSVTGAPKRRAMRLIRSLERNPRGVYCGAIGHIAPDDKACFSVAIRTVVLDDDGSGRMGTGSGIVWDSDVEAEYEECRLKSYFLTDNDTQGAFRLIETMRYEKDTLRHRAVHMDRLRESAQYFGFMLDETVLQQAIDEIVQTLPQKAAMVRLTLDRRGDVDITTGPLPDAIPEPYRLTIAGRYIDSGKAVFYHKTTRRDVYEQAFEQAQADGFDEAILLNERGEVTEGTRTNVFIRNGNKWQTPPLSSGLLAGAERHHQLQVLPNVREVVLRPDDLYEAEAIYVCNALRGMCRAQLAGP